jgi:hypothetical protein
VSDLVGTGVVDGDDLTGGWTRALFPGEQAKSHHRKAGRPTAS